MQVSADTRVVRPLVPLALSLAIGIALAILASRFPLSALAIGLATVAVTALARRTLPRALAFGATHWIVLVAAMAYTIATPPPRPDPRILETPVTLEAVLDRPVRHMADWASATARDVRLIERPASTLVAGRIRLSGPPEVLANLRYGDRIRVNAQFRAPLGFRNPGLFDYGQWLEDQGVVAVATLKPGAVARLDHQASPILDRVYEWRERIRKAALESLPANTAPFYLAMVTGETGYLTAELREKFTASGTVHLLSISGSHLGLIALVVFFLVRRAILWLPERLLVRLTLVIMPSQIAALVTAIPVIFYALLAGGEVATIRALVMILIYLVAVMIHRQGDLFNTLAFAAILILVWDPRALTDVSFQLSFLSVWCIALGVEWWSRQTPPTPESGAPGWPQRLWSKTAALLITSVAATVGTAPLVAYHFNQVNWVGVVSNPIAIPLAGILVVPLGLASGVAAAATQSPTLPLAHWNAAALDVLVRAVDFFASWPLAIAHVAAPPIAAVAVAYLVLAVLVDRRVKPWKRGLAGGVLVMLAVPWLIGTPHWTSKAMLEVTMLDVGQGDGTVVRFPSGRVMVVDGGRRFFDLDTGRLVVAPTLWNEGIDRIDYLVASHPQLDHIGGLLFVLERFPVGEVWTNGRLPDQWAAHRFEDLLARKGIPASVVPETQSLWIDAVRVWRVNPWAEMPSSPLPKRAAENDRSIVLRVEYGRASFLLTGDIEAAGEGELVATDPQWNLLRSTVLKVPHHGSRGSLDPTFLRAVAPKVAVISVGANNVYGHPARQTLGAYKRLKSKVFRTDLDGAVKILTDGSRLEVFRYQDLTAQRVPWDRGMFAAEWRNLQTVMGSPTPSLSLDLTQTELPL